MQGHVHQQIECSGALLTLVLALALTLSLTDDDLLFWNMDVQQEDRALRIDR